eukprot:14871-Chlamydomonas_euryale.AAC.1
MAWFSSYGNTAVDLFAPGVSIYSTARGGGYTYMSGTSMATPHVAGAAALLWSLAPGLSAADVKFRVLSSTDHVGLPCTSGGRLNVQKMLETVVPPQPEPEPEPEPLPPLPPISQQVRLVDDRVEVMDVDDQVWGTVCASGFDANDAK